MYLKKRKRCWVLSLRVWLDCIVCASCGLSHMKASGPQGRVLQVIYQRIGRAEIRLDMEIGVSVPAINRSGGVHGKS